MDISSIANAGIHTAGKIAVTKIAADTINKSVRGIKSTRTARVIKSPKKSKSKYLGF